MKTYLISLAIILSSTVANADGFKQKNYQSFIHKPVTGDYRGCNIYSMPPPSSGGIHQIQILNILENFDIVNMNYHGPTHIFIMAEAMKMAFADREKHMGNPEFAKDIPL